jgi:hypothetical protein
LAAANDFVFVDDDCAYGDFAVRFGGLGFGDGVAKVVEVRLGISRSYQSNS